MQIYSLISIEAGDKKETTIDVLGVWVSRFGTQIPLQVLLIQYYSMIGICYPRGAHYIVCAPFAALSRSAMPPKATLID